MKVKYTFLAAAAALSLCQALPVHAGQTYSKASDIPVEVFFKQPDYRDMVLSPDGKTIAAVVPVNGRGNLALIDLQTRKANVITSSDRFDVSSLRWLGNHFLYFSLNDGQDANGRFRHKGTYYYDVDNARTIELENSNERKKGDIYIDRIIASPTGDSPVALVTMSMRSQSFNDVYEFNLKTRKYKLLTFETPGRTTDWVVDTHRHPRIAIKSELRPKRGEPQMTTYWHKAVDGDKWEKLFEESSYENGVKYEIIGFDNDDRTLFVSTNQDGRDKMAIFKYDTVTKKFTTLMAEDPVYDIDTDSAKVRLIRDFGSDSEEVGGKVVGISYQAAKPTRVWFGESEVKHYIDGINAALPNTYNVIAASSDHQVALINSISDVESGFVSLYNDKTHSLETIIRTREWADPALMAERKVISFNARDGLPLYGYLTLPKGVPAKNLPLIVNIHGGPMVRGYTWYSWGRWPEAQFFASRGYAVLEFEPRGSKGMGAKTYTSGFKQWGGTAQDDINDAALYLVKEGIVDRNRMGLLGGSYGGYASLEGMVRDPDLWKCSNSSVAVTDLALLQSVTWSDTAEAGDARTGGYLANEFTLWVGDSEKDAAMFEKVSPARHADQVKGKIMLSMGSDDKRVPMIHGEKFRDAMVKAGKPIDYKVYVNEGHGFNKDENVFDFYHRGEKFFADCLSNPAK